MNQLTTGTWCVKVILVTGYNTDQHDLRAGGDPVLGPYTWIPEIYRGEFQEEMIKRYGNKYLNVTVDGRAFREMETMPTLEECINAFVEYLNSGS